jgi:hypothetical protein
MRRLALLLVLALASPGAADDLVREAAEAQAAIETSIRRVVAHGFAGDAGGLGAEIAGLVALDTARRQAGAPPTGLTDDVRYLAAALAPTRDARREALEELLEQRPDPLVRKLAEHRLAADDAATADRLLADDRHNRRAAVLNDAVRPLGIFSGAAVVAAVNPLLLAGSAVDSVVTTAVNLWHYNRLSTPEREALARYASALDRAPDTDDAPAIARAIQQLGTRRAEALCEEPIAAAERALDAGDLDRAAFHARSAARVDGCEGRATEPAEAVRAARALRDATDDAARWPADDAALPASPGEAADHETLVVATALGDPGAMVEAASRFRARHPDSRLAAAATYALAVARDLAGHRDGAREALAAAARDDDRSAGRHAAAVLASPDFDRLARSTVRSASTPAPPPATSSSAAASTAARRSTARRTWARPACRRSSPSASSTSSGSPAAPGRCGGRTRSRTRTSSTAARPFWRATRTARTPPTSTVAWRMPTSAPGPTAVP